MPEVAEGSLLFLGAGLLTAAWFDIRSRRIPNQLTYPLILCGILFNGFVPGALGWTDALLGFGIAFLFMTFAFVLGGMGGGDVKLMAAVGAWLGLEAVLYVILYSFVAAVVVAIVLLAWKGHLLASLKDTVLALLRGFRLPDPEASAKRASHMIPFAVMIVIGTILHLVDVRLGWLPWS